MQFFFILYQLISFNFDSLFFVLMINIKTKLIPDSERNKSHFYIIVHNILSKRVELGLSPKFLNDFENGLI